MSWVLRFGLLTILLSLVYVELKVNGFMYSGQALAKLVLAPELENVTGKYFSGWKMIPSSPESYDHAKAKLLWERSVELTQLKSQETILEFLSK